MIGVAVKQLAEGHLVSRKWPVSAEMGSQAVPRAEDAEQRCLVPLQFYD